MPLQIDAMSVDQPSRRTAGRLRRRRSDEARIQPNPVTTISRASIETEGWRAPASEAPHHVLGYPTLSLRQDRLAAGDPVWANLERRRRAATDEDGNVTISDDFDLLDSYEADRIARTITPDPRWLPAVNRMTRLQTWHLALALERPCQKRKLGWDESQTINAHRHLCRIVGQLLLAYDQLGWTLPNDYPSSASWHAELTRHAHSLTTFGTLKGGHRHYRAPDQYEAACEALRWVADHLNDLSD